MTLIWIYFGTVSKIEYRKIETAFANEPLLPKILSDFGHIELKWIAQRSYAAQF